MPIFSSCPVYFANVTGVPFTRYSDESPVKRESYQQKNKCLNLFYICILPELKITLTWNAPAEDNFFIIVSTVDHAHAGEGGHGFANVGTMYEISGVFDTKIYSSLSHNKSKSIHDIRFALRGGKKQESMIVINTDDAS